MAADFRPIKERGLTETNHVLLRAVYLQCHEVVDSMKSSECHLLK